MAAEDERLRELARSSGLSRREVRRFLQLEVVTLSGRQVELSLVRRLRRARRLRRDLGLSLDAIVIILRLLDRIEALEGAGPRRGAARIVDPPPEAGEEYGERWG